MSVNEELVKRISAELNRGLGEAQIKQRLLSEKFQDYDIDKAMRYIKSGGKEESESTKEEIIKKELPSEESLEGWDKEVEK